MLKVTPALSNGCRWDDDTTLICSLQTEAQAATLYQVEVPLLATQAGGVSKAHRAAIDYKRPYLNGYSSWDGERLTLRIHSDQPLYKNDVLSVLSLTVDGKPAALDLRPHIGGGSGKGTDLNRMFEVVWPELTGVNQRLELSIRPGLRSPSGALLGDQDTELERWIYKPTPRLFSISCGTMHTVDETLVTVSAACAPMLPISLQFTHTLTEGQIAEFRRTLTKEWEFVDHQDSLYGSLGEDWKQPTGSVLRIKTLRAEAMLTLTLGKELSLPEQAAKPLRVELSSEDFSPLWYALHPHTLLSNPTKAWLYAAELEGVQGYRLSVGTQLNQGLIDVPAEPSTQLKAIELPNVRQALKEGGFAAVWPQSNPKSMPLAYGRVLALVSAPQMDIRTFLGKGSMLVWLNDWNDAHKNTARTAIANARVELRLWTSSKLAPVNVGSAQTNAQGLALITLPTLPRPDIDSGDGFPRIIIEATRGKKRAVLVSSLNAATQTEKLWGFSDKPLYRAGERVRFQLYARDWNNGRIEFSGRNHQRELALVKQQENYGASKELLRMIATSNDSGSLSGELTLPEHARDGDYCIVRAEDLSESEWNQSQDQGACFYVGTFKPRDLWINASTPKAVLTPKDRLHLDFEVGLFSGNPAQGIAIGDIESTLQPARVVDAFPDYRDFAFLSESDMDESSDAAALKPESDVALKTNAQGRASTALILPSQLPAFTKAAAGASASLQGREPTASNLVSAFIARDASYVGLRMLPAWPALDEKFEFEAIEIDRAGKKLPARAMQLEVYFRAPSDDTDKRIQRCTVLSDQRASCEFAREKGNYRFVLSAEGVSAAERRWYAWFSSEASAPNLQLRLLSLQDAAGTPRTAQIEIQSHADNTDLLLYATQAGSLVHYQTLALPSAGKSMRLDYPIPAQWQGNIELVGVARSRVQSSTTAKGLRDVAPAAVESLMLSLPRVTSSAPLQLQFDATASKPGAQIKLRVRNTSSDPQSITVSVQDDGMRALALDVLAANPLSMLIDSLFGDESSIETASFEGLNQGTWHWFVGEADTMPTDEATWSSANDEESLDSIVVTGSRIKRISASEPSAGGQATMTGKPRRSLERSLAAQQNARSFFPDVAFWQSGIRLEANETRELVFTAPDNLTQWRAVAISENLRDATQIHQQDATFNVGLLLSARMQLPVRLFVGDQSELVVNVQHSHEKPMSVNSQVQILAGADPLQTQRLTQMVGALGEALIRVPFAATAAGTYGVRADVNNALTPAASDAVLSQFVVRDRTIADTRTQSAWMGSDPLQINFPALPNSASDARLTVRAQLGLLGIESHWINSLRDFPHRCWEQMLSRAVAASINQKRKLSDWADAKLAIDEVVNNIGVFQTHEGGFNFFPSSPAASVELTAYTLQVFDYLKQQGIAVPQSAAMRAKLYLQRRAGWPERAIDFSENLISSVHCLDKTRLDSIWPSRSQLSFSAQLLLANKLGEDNDARLTAFWDELLKDAPLIGNRRRVEWSWWDFSLYSETAFQCGLINLAKRFPDRIPVAHARELQAGLRDLYAGGDLRTDTHAAAQCLLALSVQEPETITGNHQITVNYGETEKRLVLSAKHAKAEITLPYRALQTLRVSAQTGREPLHYQAELSYQEDARGAQANAIGLGLERRFWVLKNEAWQAVGANTKIKAGDWVRVELIIRNSQTRHHVALTDTVAGGYVPTDLELSSTATPTLKKLSATGSFAFLERQLDPQTPRFYAEVLPSGEHQVYYFVRASNAGRYLVPPAQVELMYAPNSRARTASDQISIQR